VLYVPGAHFERSDPKQERTGADTSSAGPKLGSSLATHARYIVTEGSKPQCIVRLLLVNEMSPPVLLPAFFGVLRAERFFLAVTDGVDAVSCHPGRYQSLFG
jgi:hypothetical protein